MPRHKIEGAQKLSVPIDCPPDLTDEEFKLITKPLSNFEVMDFLGDGTKMHMYSVFKEMSHIDEALAPTGRCVFLYETEPNYGHYCCIFKRGKNIVEVFDSYGYLVDDELNLIKKHFRLESGQEKPYLTKLLYESGYEVHYNQYTFQADGTATCGRHCITRILNSKLSTDAYARKIERICKKEGITPDEYVCRIVDI